MAGDVVGLVHVGVLELAVGLDVGLEAVGLLLVDLLGLAELVVEGVEVVADRVAFGKERLDLGRAAMRGAREKQNQKK